MMKTRLSRLALLVCFFPACFTGACLTELSLGAAEETASPNAAPTAKASDDKIEKKNEKEDARKWIPMFDGESLDHWTIPSVGGEGLVEAGHGAITIGMGVGATGIRYLEEFPKTDYEIRYEAKRNRGYDFFGALTFPVDDSFCTFVNGGWGGGTIGLSCIDGYDASENPTTSYYRFNTKSWFEFRVRVAHGRITVWIRELKTPEQIAREKRAQAESEQEGKTSLPQEPDPNEPVVDLFTAGRKISLRSESDEFKPLGLATWVTEGAIRKIEYRKLTADEVAQNKKDVEKNAASR